MIRAVILDAYGTVLDTGSSSVAATRQVFERHGLAIEPAQLYAEWKRVHREHVESLREFATEAEIFRRDLERLYRDHGIAADAAADVAPMLAATGTRTPFADAAAGIARLRERWRVYIGSNSDAAPLAADLDRARFVVDGVHSSESLRAYKPAREFFDLLLDHIVCKPDEVVYVGDSLEDDVAGPAAAGIRTVWVDRRGKGLPAGTPAPALAVRDLSGLADALVSAFGEETVARPSGQELGLPVFGVARERYRQRPGAYAVVRDDAGRLAVVRTRKGNTFLAGGGIEEGERPLDALERELREELGIRPTRVEPLGECIEYWRSPLTGETLRTHGKFFDVREYETLGPPTDSDQALWLSPAEAVRVLLRPAQQWHADRYGR
jgi:2-haloalkanoic acid dehalogenase type II